MAIVLELPTEVEARIRDYAALEGQDVNDLLRLAVEEIAAKPVTKVWTAAELLKMPVCDREPILRAMAEVVAPLYEADLALPPAERELTAFTALDGVDPIYEYDEIDLDAVANA